MQLRSSTSAIRRMPRGQATTTELLGPQPSAPGSRAHGAAAAGPRPNFIEADFAIAMPALVAGICFWTPDRA